MPPPPLVAAHLAAVRISDGAVLLLLLLFAWWGARRGTLRQILSLAVLAGSFWAAGRFAARLEGTVGKLSALEPAARLAAAWAAVLFAGLVTGAILLSFLCCRLPERATRPGDRLVGSLLGACKGAFVLLVVGYVVLGAAGGSAVPALSRQAGDAPAEAPRSWTERVRGSVTAEGMQAGARWLAAWLVLPAWIEGRVEAVNRDLAPDRPPGGRPRSR